MRSGGDLTYVAARAPRRKPKTSAERKLGSALDGSHLHRGSARVPGRQSPRASRAARIRLVGRETRARVIAETAWGGSAVRSAVQNSQERKRWSDCRVTRGTGQAASGQYGS